MDASRVEHSRRRGSVRRNKSLGVSGAAAMGNASATVAFAPAAGRVVVEAKVKVMTMAAHVDLPVVLGADGVTPIVSVAFDGAASRAPPALR